MGRDYSKYLQFLAAEYNILYIGKASEKIFDEFSSSFLSTSKIDINKEILQKIDTTLTKRHIQVVLFDVSDNNPLIKEFFYAVKNFNEDIMTLLMFDPKEYRKVFEIVPLVDISLSYPLDKATVQKKLFMLLSREYAFNSIGRREIILKQDSAKEEEPIEKFFDRYEGSALFVADDLMEIVKNLNAGNLSSAFLKNIAKQLDEVADIFSKTKQTQSVTAIYEDLAEYLRSLDLESIEPKNLSGFTYLSEILSDVSVYLMDMFVDRIFRDVYVFEHSLTNNIEFMKNRLRGEDEDEDSSELEFFE